MGGPVHSCCMRSLRYFTHYCEPHELTTTHCYYWVSTHTHHTTPHHTTPHTHTHTQHTHTHTQPRTTTHNHAHALTDTHTPPPTTNCKAASCGWGAACGRKVIRNKRAWRQNDKEKHTNKQKTKWLTVSLFWSFNSFWMQHCFFLKQCHGLVLLFGQLYPWTVLHDFKTDVDKAYYNVKLLRYILCGQHGWSCAGPNQSAGIRSMSTVWHPQTVFSWFLFCLLFVFVLREREPSMCFLFPLIQYGLIKNRYLTPSGPVYWSESKFIKPLFKTPPRNPKSLFTKLFISEAWGLDTK